MKISFVKLTALVAIASSLGLSGCAGGGSTASAPPAVQDNPIVQPATVALPSSAAAFNVTASRTPQDSLGGISIGLLDGPPQIAGKNITAFNVGITGMDLVRDDKSTLTLFRSASPYVADLMKYQSQATPLTLVNANVPKAQYTAMRFYVNTPTTRIMLDGSAQAQPILFNLNAAAPATGSATNVTRIDSNTVAVTVAVNMHVIGHPIGITVDFNATEGLAMNAGGQITYTPVLVAANSATASTIAGHVVNAAGTPVAGAVVIAYDSASAVNSAVTDAAGAFLIKNLNGSTYTLSVFNQYTTAGGQSLKASGQTSTAVRVDVPGSVRLRGNVTGLNLVD